MFARLLALLLLLLVALPSAATDHPPVLIGLDAEFGHLTSTSAQAVERGIRIAMDEINAAGGVLGGRPLALVTTDNRSIPLIGKDNFRQLAAMPDLVAVFGGKFSPVYVECVPLAHELALPLLDPWGSADPITDHGHTPSYTFRLSLKDTWAAPAMLNFARQAHGATRIGVLLPHTAWGRSNLTALERAAAQGGTQLVATRWYNWGDSSLMTQYQEMRRAGAEAVVLVANETEGSLFVRELAALPKEQRLPIVSHWGITGGEFVKLSGEALQAVDLAVIQTFSFIDQQTPITARVLAKLDQAYGIPTAAAVKSPVGIAQAYDLTHLLARAIDRAGSTDRRAIRDALEQLGPYDGLVRRYDPPFTSQRHDALSAQDLFFARYTTHDELIPIR